MFSRVFVVIYLCPVVANQHGGSGTLTATSTLTCRDTLKVILAFKNNNIIVFYFKRQKHNFLLF
jgi:hypothetical protein